MNFSLQDSLESIRLSVAALAPEVLLLSGALTLVLASLFRKWKPAVHHTIALVFVFTAVMLTVSSWNPEVRPRALFGGMIREDSFSGFFRILLCSASLLTVVMNIISTRSQPRLPEYYSLILSVTLGACLLASSENLVMVFISLELISISSYILTGFAFDKKATEGSLKYFLFGAVASAVMLYGFSLLYGLTGTLSFTSIEFLQNLPVRQSFPLFLLAASFSLAGLLYKIAAVPMHPWAPDVYEAAPMPVVAFFSTVPKLAGVAIMSKFTLLLNLHERPDWQLILAAIVLATLTVGNFSALWQKNVKRLMAYSSIAQSGFLLVAVLVFSDQGFHSLLFYASVYVALNFLVFLYLQFFENSGLTTIADYSGTGKTSLWPSIFLLVGFIGLTGLPPTAGFTAKVFVFSALWESYATTQKSILLWVLVFGLLNTVVSLFYYLRIPYFAFVRTAASDKSLNNHVLQNLLGAFLVLVVLLLFFSPGLLMGWINKITFVF